MIGNDLWAPHLCPQCLLSISTCSRYNLRIVKLLLQLLSLNTIAQSDLGRTSMVKHNLNQVLKCPTAHTIGP